MPADKLCARRRNSPFAPYGDRLTASEESADVGDGTVRPDPDSVRSRTELARALTALRTARGLTVRGLSMSLDIPAGTLGGYFSGRHLPSSTQVPSYTEVLRACGVDDPAELARWVAALGRARMASDGRIQRRDAPYPGLQPFGRADADRFFGRESITARLLERVAALRGTGHLSAALIAVVGPSGCGKSSLLHAGLAAGFAGRYPSASVTSLTPTTARNLPDARADLVIVDQFEEIFTSFGAAERARWLHALVSSRAEGSVVVLGLRADFYASALAEPTLVATLQDEQVLVPSLTRAELRAAIVHPAARLGVTADPALTDAVLDDLASSAGRAGAHDPGALPLMSHALLAAWTHATGTRLTVADYRSAGGIAGAVQQTAEDVYAALDADAQAVSRRIFMRLVHVDGEVALTRRRVANDELRQLAEPGEVDRILGLYVDRRLLTQDADSVQISHEALVTAWPRLHEWIDADGASARIHRQLTDAANVWADSGCDPTLLLAGGRLVTAGEWRSDAAHEAELNERERAFLDRSEHADQAQRTAERRANRRLRQLLAAVVVLLVAASVLAVVAFRAGSRADRSRAAEAAARREALSRELAAQSDLLATTSPNLAAQLAVEAVRVDDNERTRSALVDRTGAVVPTRLATPGLQPLQAVAVAARTRWIAAAGLEGRVDLWRQGQGVPAAQPPLQPAGERGTLFALAFTPDGSTLFAAGAAGTVAVWDMSGPRPEQVGTVRGFDTTVYGLAVDPAGNLLAAASADGSIRVWPLVAGRPVGDGTRIGVGAAAQALAFAPDGRRLAVGLADGNVVFVHLTGAHSVSKGIFFGDRTVNAVAFTPDGRQLAVGSSDHTAYLIALRGDALDGTAQRFGPAHTRVNAVAFRADGTRLLVGSSDQQVIEYDVADGTVVAAVGSSQPVTSMVVSGTSVVTASTDGYVDVRPADGNVVAQTGGTVFNVGYDADGSRLVIGPGSTDGAVHLWRADGARLVRAGSVRSPDGDGAKKELDGSASISPDGRLVASGTGDGAVYLWDARDPQRPALIGRLPDRTAPGLVENTAFSPDGHLVVASGDDGEVRVWDISTPDRPRETAVLDDATNYLDATSFSPDGRFLAAGSADQHGYVWQLDGPDGPHRIAKLGGFNSYVYGVAFSPTSDLLALGDTDVRLYRVDGRRRGARRPGAARPAGGGVRAGVLAGRAHGGRGRAGRLRLSVVGAGGRPGPRARRGGHPAVLDRVQPGRIDAAGGRRGQRGAPLDPRPAAGARALCARVGAGMTRGEWTRYLPDEPYDPPCA